MLMTFALLLVLVLSSGEASSFAAPFESEAACHAKLPEVVALAQRSGAVLYAAACAPLLPGRGV